MARNGTYPLPPQDPRVIANQQVLEYDIPSLRDDTVVHIWQDSSDAKAVLAKGYKIVHASADYLYLDCGHGGWIGLERGGNSWCDPFKTWARIWS